MLREGMSIKWLLQPVLMAVKHICADSLFTKKTSVKYFPVQNPVQIRHTLAPVKAAIFVYIPRLRVALEPCFPALQSSLI